MGGLRLLRAAGEPAAAGLAACLPRHKPAGEMRNAVGHQLQVVGRQPALQVVGWQVAEACGNDSGSSGTVSNAKPVAANAMPVPSTVLLSTDRDESSILSDT